jgi:hypothetical protein
LWKNLEISAVLGGEGRFSGLFRPRDVLQAPSDGRFYGLISVNATSQRCFAQAKVQTARFCVNGDHARPIDLGPDSQPD